MASSPELKSVALMDQMKTHFSTDAGKALTKKINLVYQIHIAPKKVGFNEEIYVVDLKKGEVTKGNKLAHFFFFRQTGKNTSTSSAFKSSWPEVLQSLYLLGRGPYEEGKPDATFSFTDADFFKIATGKMNPQMAFMMGKMKVKGSLSAAQKFTPDIFPKPSKM